MHETSRLGREATELHDGARSASDRSFGLLDDNSIGGLSDLRQPGRGTALGEAARTTQTLRQHEDHSIPVLFLVRHGPLALSAGRTRYQSNVRAVLDAADAPVLGRFQRPGLAWPAAELAICSGGGGLCDSCRAIEGFRREIHTLLSCGESVHQLQRAVYTGKVPTDRGRRRDETKAISGSHALLTNIVLAWNTNRMNEVVERLRKDGMKIDDAWLRRIGPVHFGHINFRGAFRFGVDKHAQALLRQSPTSRRSVQR